MEFNDETSSAFLSHSSPQIPSCHPVDPSSLSCRSLLVCERVEQKYRKLYSISTTWNENICTAYKFSLSHHS
ncbi:hypothetical protein JTE90_020229 [Oedothorax gibbosus]|uniref:Uncharacterized protein n=1 Tax=Oedothorax gibbosus TaxID=931172 RepID=A0AAV6UYE4_9ARAC|nr:hypothetical protein JTE90_020229 [Oedothorax gibbosus]